MDLAALKAHLDSLGPTATLRVADTDLPAELTALLASMPGGQIAVAVGADGVALVGDTLTVAGRSADAWAIPAMTGVSVTLATATLTVTDTSPTPTVGAALTGTLPVGAATPAAIALAPVSEPVTGADTTAAGWVLSLAGDTGAVTPQALVLLGSGAAELPVPVPASLDVFGGSVVVAPGSFGITFFPGTTYATLYRFTVTDPAATWTLITGKLAVTGIDLVVLDITGTAPPTSSTAIQLVAHLTVDGVALDIVVSMSRDPHWTITVQPGEGADAFPGIAALASYLCPDGVAGETTSSFGEVGFGVGGFDAAIAKVTVGFDWQAMSLESLRIASLLTLGALKLDVVLVLPAITITGNLHGPDPVPVSDILAGFDLPPDGVPASLAVTEADFQAQPTAGTYLASLTVTGNWPADPVALDKLTLTVGRDPLDGVTALIDCTLAIGPTIEVELEAGYGGAATGWEFSGATAPGSTLAMGDLISELATSWGIPSVPAPVAALTLTDLSLSYQSGTGHFAFACTAETAVTDTPVTVTVGIDVTRTQAAGGAAGGNGGGDGDGSQTIVGTKGWSATFSGTITVAELVFSLRFDVASTGTDIFVASYTHTGDATTVSLHDLVAGLSATAAEVVPADLSIGLTDVKLAVVAATGKPTSVAFGVDLSAKVDLSELPIVGDKLPEGETLSIDDLQIVYSTQPLDATTTGTVNGLFAAGVVPLPAAGLAGGPAVAATFTVGGSTETIELGVPTAPAPPGPPAIALPAAAPPAAGDAPAPAAAPLSSAPASYWIDVQKQLGIIQIGRVGVMYQDNALLFGIDGGIALGPLTLSLQGLAVGSPLSAFSPTFSLDGLGLGYVSGPLTIAGALLRVPGPSLSPGVAWQFDGAAVVEAETFGLAAIGSYAQLTDGQPSLFVYAQLEAPLGGPPAFFVTGLMAGFGFNRDLVVPSVDQVAGFPLVALGTPPAPGTQAPPRTPTDILAILEGREPIPPSTTGVQWIAPRAGSYWLAVGLEFTSFEIVTTKALLIAEFGQDFLLALLGTSTLQLPTPEESAETYAYVELEIEAVFDPTKGFFGLSAELAPASYVLTAACHLTGGFAFYLWFPPSDHAGQFVVTLGGYHPAFDPPPYFPKVPRLGFNWKVSSDVDITGSAYFALTTTCIMAGAGLSVVFHSGDLRAWFIAQADVLVSWRPFFFTAQISVSIGVSYRFSIFGIHKTLSVSLGASVDLWGPPTGGRVHVHLWIVSFTVAFGSSGASTATQPLSWPDFATLLPAEASRVSVLPVAGVSKMTDTDDTTTSTSGKVWVARATGLAFSTQAAAPASRLSYGPPSLAHRADLSEDAVQIRPMNRTGLAAVHQLELRFGSPTAPPDPLDGWSLTPRRQNLPDSLWGAPPVPFSQVPAVPAAELVTGALVGYDVAAPPAALGPTPGAIGIEEYASEPLPPGTLPLDAAAPPTTDYVPEPDPTSAQAIAGIAAAAPARDALVAVLATVGYTGANDPLDTYAANAGHQFSDAPMLEGTPA